ncbi:MAG: hypothetical protein ACP5LO_03055 [Calditerrivibrio sp.]|uniref:hypothetical protein n=1 Tax=Calditerrivibrio sp. TaxID=2792612 RepID=UPI003D0D4B85
MIFRTLLLLTGLLFIFSCAPDPFKESFENAKNLVSQNRLEEAYSIYKDLCQKVPENKEYCQEYNKISRLIFDSKFKKINSDITSVKSKMPLIPIPLVMKFEDDTKKLYEYNIDTEEVNKLAAQIANEKKLSINKKESVFAQAEQFLKNKEYSKAISLLKENSYLDQSIFDIKINEYKNAAIGAMYPEILKLVEQEEWKKAHPLINQVYEIDKDYQNISSLKDEASQKDTADYYLKKAEEAKKNKKLDLAVKYYNMAMEYPDDENRVKELYNKAIAEFSELYFQLGIDYAQQDFVWQAYDNFKKGFDLMLKIPVEKRGLVKIPKKDLNRYYDNLYLKAKKAEDGEKLGLTFLYYKLLFNLNPAYPDLKENMKKLEEKILSRAIKSLAIIPFKSPKSAPEAGGLFTSNIMLSLYNELKDDLKIIERESTDVLLKEFELNLASQSVNKPSGLKIASADYFLLGDVLDYKVESSIQEGKKSVRVKTRVDMVLNPAYEDWEKLAVKLEKEGKSQEIPPAPSKYLEKPVFEDVKYNVKYFKKVAILSVSYRIVDVNGKLIHTGLADIKKEAIDESSEGVEIGEFKIPFKVAQLPTDAELLKKAQNEAIAKIKDETKEIFKDSEGKYLKQAKDLEKDNNITESIEKYVDAIMIMKRKKLPSDELEQRIMKYVDAIVN